MESAAGGLVALLAIWLVTMSVGAQLWRARQRREYERDGMSARDAELTVRAQRGWAPPWFMDPVILFVLVPLVGTLGFGLFNFLT